MDAPVGPSTKGTSWVCPNDRQLALRAKLRTGWSVKTAYFESKWNDSNSCSSAKNRRGQSFPLSEEERQAIIQVIQRADALDTSEQERIGRLVERLENLKRNVYIITSTRLNEKKNCGSRCSSGAHCVCSCALCGEKFGIVLGATPVLCKDCRKYVCQKCGIEITGLNAMWAKISSVPRAALVAQTPQEETTMQRIIRRSSRNIQRQFLCRICAETREMWKKSGAWFLRGMPKYILPEKKKPGWSRTPLRTSPWSASSTKSVDSTEPQDSSSDEDTRRLAVTRCPTISTSSLHEGHDNSSMGPSSPNPARSPGSAPRSPRGGRINYLSPLNSREEGSDQFDKSTLSIPSQCGRVSPIGSISPRSRKSPNVLHEQHVSFEDEILIEEKNKIVGSVESGDECKRDVSPSCRPRSPQVQSLRSAPSTAPTTPTTPTFSMERLQDSLKSCDKYVGRESSQSHSDRDSFSSATHNSQSDLPPLQATDHSQEIGQDYGTLEVCLRYDPAAQCLQCKVEQARGLRPMDIHGLADPFCKLNILPIEMTATTKRLRTKTVHKTRDPVFNEVVNFYGTTENDLKNKALHVLILQDDPAGQDFLGEAKFPLRDLEPCHIKRYKVSLQDHYPVNSEDATWGVYTTGRGQIQISLSYCTRRRALMVTVHRALNLLPMDSNGFSDPFVKLCLLEETKCNHRQQRVLDYSIARSAVKKLVSKKITNRNVQSTSTKKKTLNPEWNEEFAFATRLTDLMKLTLYLSVWDKDFGKSNDYLGGLELSCNSKGARLRHWLDVMKFPDHRHPAWHNLTEGVIPTE